MKKTKKVVCSALLALIMLAAGSGTGLAENTPDNMKVSVNENQAAEETVPEYPSDENLSGVESFKEGNADDGVSKEEEGSTASEEETTVAYNESPDMSKENVGGDNDVEMGTIGSNQQEICWLSQTSLELKEGECAVLKLDGALKPETVEWKTGNRSVASVSNGMVSPVAPGRTEIIAVYKGVSYTCNVTVKVPVVQYTTHMQSEGWKAWVKDGEVGGTTGYGKRMESVKIEVKDTALTGKIEYRTHVQNLGWINWSADGAENGTTGQAKRVEALQLRLTGELAQKYDIYYRVHIQTLGWLDWAKNGETAGSTGLSLRTEAIQVKLVRKGEKAPGSTSRVAVSIPSVQYKTHVQTYGWQEFKHDGQSSGTTGSGKRLESIVIQTSGNGLGGGVTYKTHVEKQGWTDWVSNGQQSGTVGQARRLEAIQMILTGDIAKVCDIYYRVHVQGYGWLNWAKNGELAGTEGLKLRLEAIEIVIAAKNGTPPVSWGSEHFIKFTKQGSYSAASKTFYFMPGGVRLLEGWNRYNGKKVYVRNGGLINGWTYADGCKLYFENGILRQNVEALIGNQSSYEIRINVQQNCLTVYARDGINGYIIPVKTFAVSCGVDSPLGTYYTPAKYRWRAMLGGSYAQWATRITGNFLMHSVPYSAEDNHTLKAAEFNKLGSTASAGCIRMNAANAKWIYDHCGLNTKVVLYRSSATEIFDKPAEQKIPEWQNWDPTDPTI